MTQFRREGGKSTKMNSPYKGRFIVTQRYKEHEHDGLDLVGIDDKNIYAVEGGKVIHAGKDKHYGFGNYVAVEIQSGDVWYYGHLSAVKVSLLQAVDKGDLLGVEGSTGNSTGSHLHICIRKGGSFWKGYDCSSLLGIPNKETNVPLCDKTEKE